MSAAILALPAVAAALAAAPGPDSVLRGLASLQAGGFDPQPGKWVVYRIGPEPFRYMRVAVVGVEKTPRGEGRWLEIGLGTDPQGSSIGMKLLAVGDPRQGLSLDRILYRLGMGPTNEMDRAEVERVRRTLPARPAAAASPDLRPEQFEDVTTEAGVFHCARLDMPGGRFWLSADAPVFHLAKAGLGDGTSLEVFAMGDGARDSMGEPRREAASTADGGARR